jgi:hypothetical protein
VAGVEDADFGFFIRQYRFHHFHAHCFQRRATGNEVVLHHPLDEGLTHDGAGVVLAGGCLYPGATSGVGRGVMRSTMQLGLLVWLSTQASKRFATQLQNCFSPRESARRYGAGCHS